MANFTNVRTTAAGKTASAEAIKSGVALIIDSIELGDGYMLRVWRAPA